MRRRQTLPHQTLPHLWLISDPRGGNPAKALERMPRGSGVVFRHFELKRRKRAKLFAKVRSTARRRGALLLLAESPDAHGRWTAIDPDSGLMAVTVHNRRELIAAWREGADFVFVSPVFATRSHPDARPLGPVRLGLMLRDNVLPAVALGGMNAQKFRKLNGLGLHGWAGIDAFA